MTEGTLSGLSLLSPKCFPGENFSHHKNDVGWCQRRQPACLTILTQTRVARHGPGDGADLTSIFWPPQALKLHELTGGTDKGAQALWGRAEITGFKHVFQLVPNAVHGGYRSRNAALIYFNANPRHICLIERCDRLTFIVLGEERQERWGQGNLFTSPPHYSRLMTPRLSAQFWTCWDWLIIKRIYYHGRINDPLFHSEEPPSSDEPEPIMSRW